MFVPVCDRDGRALGGAAGAVTHRTGSIAIEIAGAMVRAEPGVDLGWLQSCAARCEGEPHDCGSGGNAVLVATRPVDFRKGADGLVALVRETLRETIRFLGTVFVFRSKRTDRVKIFWSGMARARCCIGSRLEQGAFRWPPVTDGVMRLTSAQLALRAG